jgi:hypothetical protein
MTILSRQNFKALVAAKPSPDISLLLVEMGTSFDVPSFLLTTGFIYYETTGT